MEQKRFEIVTNAIWLADGEIPVAAKILKISEEELLDLTDDQAAFAFTGRPADWSPADSLSGSIPRAPGSSWANVVILSDDGCAGSFKVLFEGNAEPEETAIVWSPHGASLPTNKVGVVPILDGEIGIGHVIEGDVWRDLEDNELLPSLWRLIGDGHPVEDAVYLASLDNKPTP